MRVDLQDKSLKEMKPVSSFVNQQGKFHFTKNERFHNFCKDIAHIFESFLISQCLHKKFPATLNIAVLFDIS